MTKIFNRLLLLACLMAPTAATAQVCLVSKGKPQGRIVLAEDNDVNRKAAKMLQRFVRETSGAELDITATAKRAKNDVVIGGKTTEATDDGYAIDCTRGALTIKSAGGKGAIYGVSALLEKCRAWTISPRISIRLLRRRTSAFRRCTWRKARRSVSARPSAIPTTTALTATG